MTQCGNDRTHGNEFTAGGANGVTTVTFRDTGSRISTYNGSFGVLALGGSTFCVNSDAICTALLRERTIDELVCGGVQGDGDDVIVDLSGTSERGDPMTSDIDDLGDSIGTYTVIQE